MNKTTLLIVLVALVSFAAGVMVDAEKLVGTQQEPDPGGLEAISAAGNDAALEHARKHLDPHYVCPMHAEIVSDEPGSCPICGMDLVKIQPGDGAADDSAYPEVRIAWEMINNMGVRVAEVKRKTLVRTIETPGFIQQMRKSDYSRYNAPARGKVSKFYFRTGEWHEPGDPLVDIELDDLVLVQKKHLELLAGQDAASSQEPTTGDEASPDKEGGTDSTGQDADSGTDKTEAAPTLEKTRALMKLAGMTDAQIEKLEQTGETSPTITLYATHPGEVKELRVAVGDTVKPRQLLFTLGGLMQVSVLANAFQRDASWVRAGQEVDITLPHDAQKHWKGRVSSGAVTINTNSQNIGVKLSFEAPDSLVKSGMYVVGSIYGQVRKDVLTIPRDAVIYSGNEKRVVRVIERGRFKPVRVKTGIANDTEIEILSGLDEGDTIVVSAQFLIDSESSLQANYRRMSGAE